MKYPIEVMETEHKNPVFKAGKFYTCVDDHGWIRFDTGWTYLCVTLASKLYLVDSAGNCLLATTVEGIYWKEVSEEGVVCGN